MGINEIVAALDEEIGRLQQVRSLLAGTNGNVTHAATSFAYGTNQAKNPRKKRHMSAEARERIAAAQRKRWAAQKKAAK
ncbi:MAG: hypothetical protein WBW84_06875 [Acidobacteriaceae bacterium]